MTDHDWFREHLTLYGTGALAADEGDRFERHAAECGACALELAQWRLFDRSLDRLCAPVHFSADWNQRVLARWHAKQNPPKRWAASVRWAGAAAAVVMLGLLGAAVHAVAALGFVAFPGADAIQAERSMPVVLPLFAMNAEGGRPPNADGTATTALVDEDGIKGRRSLGRSSGEFMTPDLKVPIKNSSYDVNNSNDDLADSVKLNGRLSKHGESTGWDYRNLDGVSMVEKQFEDRVYTPFNRFKTDLGEKIAESNRPVKFADNGTVAMGGLLLGKQQSESPATESFRRLDDLTSLDDLARTPQPEKAWGRSGTFGYANGGKPSDAAVKETMRDAKESLNFGLQVEFDTKRAADGPAKMNPEPVDLAKQTGKRAGDAKATGITVQDGSVKYADAGAKLANKYFTLPGERKAEVTNRTELSFQPPVPPLLGLSVPKQQVLQDKQQKAEAEYIAAQIKPDPQMAQRKIIRTGELEFEVDVFDNAVAQITKLIGAIPGAFVATVNSDKLPNGKVKGSVVVRVPPEQLDKFVVELRQSFAKMGELKTQRIGSQDVTKQYTDIESRLRAARTMEDRFLNIIKNGKGEVKDLIAAERELGVWRTKIEEMEGEIRYYNNQVGLSTLTITAYEKEIRAAAAMVISERVTMKIEADDVEKSLQAALAAVTEAKGRITKSDLKQHAAGQYEAILQFEIAPAAAALVKDKLKLLGIVTHQDAQRTQQAEGGTAPTGDQGGTAPKLRTNDVQFNVTLYNVANIQPREAFVLQIAVGDVPAEYRKLLDAVTAAKGQVRVSQLDEKEKANVFAQLDFDVPSGQSELFDKQLAAVGDVVSRNTTRAGPGETSTDRKVGYRLTLKSLTSIAPRDTFTMQVYSLDVPGAYKKLQETAAQVKGHIRALQLNEQDKNAVTAQFDIDVPVADRATIEKLLEDIGDVHTRTTNRVQPNEIATEKKVGYRLTLKSQVPPRETVDMIIEVKDVDRAVASFGSLVLAVKGTVKATEMTQDAGGRTVANQFYEAPLAAKDELTQKFKQAGVVRAQKATQNLQAPASKLATAHFYVRFVNVTPIVPSDEGLWSQVRKSLGYAFWLLSISLMFVIVGISVLLPWALVAWVGVKFVRRMRTKSQAT